MLPLLKRRDVDATCDWLTIWWSQAPGQRCGVLANIDEPIGGEREALRGVLEQMLYAIVDGVASDDRAGLVGERDVPV